MLESAKRLGAAVHRIVASRIHSVLGVMHVHSLRFGVLRRQVVLLSKLRFEMQGFSGLAL